MGSIPIALRQLFSGNTSGQEYRREISGFRSVRFAPLSAAPQRTQVCEILTNKDLVSIDPFIRCPVAMWLPWGRTGRLLTCTIGCSSASLAYFTSRGNQR